MFNYNLVYSVGGDPITVPFNGLMSWDLQYYGKDAVVTVEYPGGFVKVCSESFLDETPDLERVEALLAEDLKRIRAY